jgi:hypothetical protein
MTHDELLVKIQNQESLNSQSLGNGSIGNALRAVVELHKPVKRENYLDVLMCDSCEYSSYPCSTIKAIQEQLQ